MAPKMVAQKKSAEFWTYADLSVPISVGLYYGFTPSGPVAIDKQRAEKTKPVPAGIHVDVNSLFGIFNANFQKNIPQLPLMTVRPAAKAEKGAKHATQYVFDIVGSNRSIADATVITCAHAVVLEEGYEDVLIHVNSIGDRESFGRFTRELSSYFKKHAGELDPECRQALKKGPLEIMECAHEKCAIIKDEAPQPINYLSEMSRTHFKEILEFLEMTELPYVVNSHLIENAEYGTHTVFSISGRRKGEKESVEVARGMRWTGIAKKMGLKKDIQGVSACVSVKQGASKAKRIRKPQCYLIQMGQEAKSRSLLVIDILRKAGIPVYHSLTKDKFAAQLASAEHLKVPHILIIGQKESLEHTVLVRQMSNRSQETVKIDGIADYLKKHLN